MKVLSVLTLATAALAAPQSWKGWAKGQYQKSPDNCLSDAQANNIIDLANVYQLKADLDAARAAGEFLFDPVNFREYGDSINALRGDPYGTLVEPNGTVYVENVLSAPPLQRIDTLAILHNCTHIINHWDFYGVGGPQSQSRVRGFTLLGVDPSKESQMVYFAQVEFNSIAWGVNTGFSVTPPSTGQYAPDGGQ